MAQPSLRNLTGSCCQKWSQSATYSDIFSNLTVIVRRTEDNQKQAWGLSHIATKYVSPEESMEWLRATMKKRGLTLNSMAEETGINKGNIYRYFTQQQRPRVDVLPVLCEALKTTPATLLVQMGVMPKTR